MSYKLDTSLRTGALLDIVIRKSDNAIIPCDPENRDYKQYLQDLKDEGMQILEVNDIGDAVINGTMWHHADNAEQLVIDKYGSDSDKLTIIREDRYVKAMKAKTPYEKKIDAYKIIDATPQDIKDKYNHLPMRR